MAEQNLDTELSKLRIDKSRKRANGRGYGKIVALLLAAGVCGGGYSWYAKAHAPIEVKVAKVEREVPGVAESGLAVVTANGYVIPRKQIEVSSQIIARVKDILVDRGSKVKAGDILIRLEDDQYAAQVRQAEAQLAAAKANLAKLRAGSRPEEIAAARATVASVQATLDQSRLDLERARKLVQAQVSPQQDLDKAQTAYDVALAALNSAKKNCELVELGPRKEDIAAAEAQERQAEASLEYAKTQLDFTVIRAPVDGTILEKVAEKGELVTNINFGGTRGAKSSVVTMADLRDLQVEIDVNENDLPKVHPGQKCEVRLDSDPNAVIKGEVDEIAPQADRQKATVQVKVRLINPGPTVRTEVNARVTFLSTTSSVSSVSSASTVPSAQARVWIPREALAKNAAGETIVYIAADGVAAQRKVVTGGEGDKGVVVTEGLTGTESLIVEPLDKISDGAQVAIKG